MSAGLDFDHDPDWDEGHNCMTCGGEGWEYCEEYSSIEGCWERDCNGATHTCFNCRGSGAAKDQWFW